MRSKRRSIVVTGVMLSALVFGSTAASAQTAPPGASAVEVSALGYDQLLVSWTSAANNTDPPASGQVIRASYQVGYLKHASATAFGAGSPMTMTVNAAQSQAVLTGLDAGSRYVVAVRAIAGAANADVTDKANQPWQYPTAAPVSTSAAPMPETILERDIMVTEGDMELDVEWDAPRPDSTSRTSTLTITEYEVSFGEKADGSDSKVWPATITSPVVNLDRLKNDTKYYIAIRSKNSAGGWSMYDWSEAAEGTPMAPAEPELTAPMNVMADAGDGMIDVSWDAVEGADSYKVSWMMAGGSATSSDTAMGTSYTIENLMNGTEYSVQVSAMKGDMEGPMSTAMMATPMADPLDAPMNVMVEAGDGMIMVSWDAVDRADDYKVSWTAGGVTASAMTMGATSYTIENLMNGTEYSVQVSGMMGDMEGPMSTAMTATPMPVEPVPALPLFGMLALGAGLVAAGRRRLHAQRLLKN